MIKEEVRVKAGYEEIHAMATDKLNKLEEAIRKEIEERIAKDKETLLGIISGCEEIVEVEIADEVPSEETLEQPTEVGY